MINNKKIKKLKDKEVEELKYLAKGGTMVSNILRRKFLSLKLIVTRSVFSNSPYNGSFDELTPLGEAVVFLST